MPTALIHRTNLHGTCLPGACQAHGRGGLDCCMSLSPNPPDVCHIISWPLTCLDYPSITWPRSLPRPDPGLTCSASASRGGGYLQVAACAACAAAADAVGAAAVAIPAEGLSAVRTRNVVRIVAVDMGPKPMFVSRLVRDRHTALPRVLTNRGCLTRRQLQPSSQPAAPRLNRRDT